MESQEKDNELKTKKEEISTSTENATLMPNVSLEQETDEKIQNLSAIIPQFEDNGENQPVLESRETVLKSDGAVVLGMYNESTGVASYNENATLPAQIDIEARKKEKINNKNKKKKNSGEDQKKGKNKLSKSQNITALIALLVIVGLLYFYFGYYKKLPTKNSFSARTVTVELGTRLPIRIADYINLPKGETVNEMAYTLDTSKVEIDKVGEYTFTIKKNNITKTGKIIVVDTTPPSLETRQVVILEGEPYTPEQFVVACSDLSGCNYEFKDAISASYKDAGTYTLFITVKDAYNNEIVKQVPLIIEAQGMRLYYRKLTGANIEENYQLIEEHELHFVEEEIFDDAIILNGTHSRYYEYSNSASYQKAKDENIGRLNYSFDDERQTMIIREPESSVGYNYTRMRDINDYLTSEGFNQTSEPYIE